jgi:hypothetical protein
MISSQIYIRGHDDEARASMGFNLTSSAKDKQTF